MFVNDMLEVNILSSSKDASCVRDTNAREGYLDISMFLFVNDASDTFVHERGIKCFGHFCS